MDREQYQHSLGEIMTKHVKTCYYLFVKTKQKKKKARPANDLRVLIKLCIRCKKLISDLTFIHYCIHDLLKDLPITLMNMSYRANVVRGSSILSK